MEFFSFRGITPGQVQLILPLDIDQWDNGEPITYENWIPDDFFSEASDVGGRDYAVMTFFDGKWYAVGPNSAVRGMTKEAILEKTDLHQ